MHTRCHLADYATQLVFPLKSVPFERFHFNWCHPHFCWWLFMKPWRKMSFHHLFSLDFSWLWHPFLPLNSWWSRPGSGCLHDWNYLWLSCHFCHCAHTPVHPQLVHWHQGTRLIFPKPHFAHFLLSWASEIVSGLCCSPSRCVGNTFNFNFEIIKGISAMLLKGDVLFPG